MGARSNTLTDPPLRRLQAEMNLDLGILRVGAAMIVNLVASAKRVARLTVLESWPRSDARLRNNLGYIAPVGVDDCISTAPNATVRKTRRQVVDTWNGRPEHVTIIALLVAGVVAVNSDQRVANSARNLRGEFLLDETAPKFSDFPVAAHFSIVVRSNLEPGNVDWLGQRLLYGSCHDGLSSFLREQVVHCGRNLAVAWDAKKRHANQPLRVATILAESRIIAARAFFSIPVPQR